MACSWMPMYMATSANAPEQYALLMESLCFSTAFASFSIDFALESASALVSLLDQEGLLRTPRRRLLLLGENLLERRAESILAALHVIESCLDDGLEGGVRVVIGRLLRLELL